MRYIWVLGAWSCADSCLARYHGSDSAGDTFVDSAGHTGETGDTGHPDPTAHAEHVVVMVMDGARVEETFGTDQHDYSDALSKNTDEMFVAFKDGAMHDGTLVRPGYNTGIPITGPGHCYLLTGQRVNFGHFAATQGGGYYRPEVPTLYEAIKATFPDAYTVLAGNTDHMRPLDYSLYPGWGAAYGAFFDFVADEEDAGQPNGKDEAVITEVQTQLSEHAPALIVANLHSMDRAGHYNNDPTSYGTRVDQVADELDTLWSWIQSDGSGLKDKTALVIVADHGRHRWLDEADERLEGQPESKKPDYRNHGDQCRGCRELPMWLAGPGIKKDAVVSTPYTQEDVARTIAYLLGVELPYSDGLVMTDILDAAPPAGTDRQGDIRPSIADDLVAYEQLSDDPSRRSEIVVDGETVSTRSLAEEPRVARNDLGDFVCWREMQLDVASEAIDWPWLARCLQRDTAADEWTDIGFPIGMVWPLWAASFTTLDGQLFMAISDNANSTTYSDTQAGVALVRWSPTDQWDAATDNELSVLFPNNPTITQRDNTLYLAFSASDYGEGADTTGAGRYTRHIEVYRAVWDGASPTFTALTRTYVANCPEEADCPENDPTLDDTGAGYERMEAAAIANLSGGLAVGFLGYNSDGNTVLLTTSDESGDHWDDPVKVDDTGRVLGSVNPVWAGGALYWARLSATDTVEICHAAPGDAASCSDTAAPHIFGLASDGSRVVASLDSAVAHWEVVEVP